jgi:hypothetical protein
LVGKPEWNTSLEKLGVDGRIILNVILEKSGLRVRTGYGPVAGSCDHGDEPSGSIKGGEFLD